MLEKVAQAVSTPETVLTRKELLARAAMAGAGELLSGAFLGVGALKVLGNETRIDDVAAWTEVEVLAGEGFETEDPSSEEVDAAMERIIPEIVALVGQSLSPLAKEEIGLPFTDSLSLRENLEIDKAEGNFSAIKTVRDSNDTSIDINFGFSAEPHVHILSSTTTGIDGNFDMPRNISLRYSLQATSEDTAIDVNNEGAIRAELRSRLKDRFPVRPEMRENLSQEYTQSLLSDGDRLAELTVAYSDEYGVKHILRAAYQVPFDHTKVPQFHYGCTKDFREAVTPLL